MWIWCYEGWKVVDSPNRVDRILVAAGIASSIADATRLIKQGAIRVDGQQVREPRTPLREGFPCLVRVGRHPLRMMAREGRDGWDIFPAAREVMFPLPQQGLRSWNDIWGHDRLRWLPYWLDRLEQFWSEKVWPNLEGLRV